MTSGWALVTGASAGIGAEFARQLAAQAYDLVLVARRAAPMQALASELTERHGVRVEILTADLAVGGEPARLFDTLQARGIDVEFLVNNAGASGPDLLADRDWAAQSRYIELMMTSVAAMCHHFIPPMRERQSGRVINVASVAGLVAFGGDYSYGPTKAYLVALSRSLALSLQGDGVRVMALCPGFTHTDFHASDALTKMKRGSPDWLWYDADVVVREGLAAIERGRSVYTSGRLYRWFVPLLRTAAGRALLRSLGIRRQSEL